jgi:hypothetical protein
MVQYGGFISDNEDQGAEASAVKDSGGVKLKKPVKGLYACIFFFGSLQVTETLFELTAIYSDSKQ